MEPGYSVELFLFPNGYWYLYHHDVSHCIRMNIWPNPSFTPIFAIFVGEIPHLQTSIMLFQLYPLKYIKCVIYPLIYRIPHMSYPHKVVGFYIYQ